MPVTQIGISVSDAATYTIKAENSGLVHWMPNLTADITITPPTPKAGLWFEFAYAGAAADAQGWIIDTGSNANYFKGGVLHADLDGDTVDPIRSDGNSNSIFTVLVPDVGTRIRLECLDDTTWNVCGYVASATAPTFADQA